MQKQTVNVSKGRMDLRTIGMVLIIGLGAVVSLRGQTVLSLGHADIGVVYEDGAWDLHVHDGEANVELEPGDATFLVGLEALSPVPAGSSYNFLGAAGSPIWILPQVENPSLLFLGIGTEEQALGVFLNDQITLRLENVNGPGHFFLYDVSGLGVPTVRMNSQDGLDGADSVVLNAGGHRHANWVFNAPGDYQLSFRASGVLIDGSVLTLSDPATYHFSVIPEPGGLALLAVGGVVWAVARRRRSAI